MSPRGTGQLGRPEGLERLEDRDDLEEGTEFLVLGCDLDGADGVEGLDGLDGEQW